MPTFHWSLRNQDIRRLPTISMVSLNLMASLTQESCVISYSTVLRIVDKSSMKADESTFKPPHIIAVASGDSRSSRIDPQSPLDESNAEAEPTRSMPATLATNLKILVAYWREVLHYRSTILGIRDNNCFQFSIII